MNGKIDSLKDIFDLQVGFQEKILERGAYGNPYNPELPTDNISVCSYHVQQLISEIGEVLSADKRWKTHRNDKLDMQNKQEEIADCFIVLMNIAMFSGMSGEDLCEVITNKIKENFNRLESK